MFKRPPLEPKVFVDSIARHSEVIQNKGVYSSAFEMQDSNRGGHRYHTLVLVQANGVVYAMKDIDLSLVLHMMYDGQHLLVTNVRKKERAYGFWEPILTSDGVSKSVVSKIDWYSQHNGQCYSYGGSEKKPRYNVLFEEVKFEELATHSKQSELHLRIQVIVINQYGLLSLYLVRCLRYVLQKLFEGGKTHINMVLKYISNNIYSTFF